MRIEKITQLSPDQCRLRGCHVSAGKADVKAAGKEPGKLDVNIKNVFTENIDICAKLDRGTSAIVDPDRNISMLIVSVVILVALFMVSCSLFVIKLMKETTNIIAMTVLRVVRR